MMLETPSKARFRILERQEHGERFWKLTILHRDEGRQYALLRMPGKGTDKKGAQTPDLGDEAEARISRGQQEVWFLREYQVIRRLIGLGTSYDRLLWASRLIRLILPNLRHIDDNAFVYDLVTRTLDAIDGKPNPCAAYCKFLFLFARHEGYPMGEHWLRGLPSGLRDASLHLLQEPLERIKVEDSVVADIRQSIETYLAAETELIVQASGGTLP